MTDRRNRVKVSGFKHDKKVVDNNDFAYGPRCDVYFRNDGRH